MSRSGLSRWKEFSGWIMMQKNKLEILDWGQLEYGLALERQKILVDECLKGESGDRLIIVEHPPVVTLGQSGSQDDLRVTAEELRAQGVSLISVDRGGRATCHVPGQMVAYPIIKLETQDLHWYVRTLLTTVASVLRTYGLDPEQKKGNPGLWVRGKKIASIGVAVKQWITFHGIALNVSNDLSLFSYIVPCGHPTEIITSIEKETGVSIDQEEVKRRFIREFCERFNYEAPSVSRHPTWLQIPSPQTMAAEKTEWLLSTMHLHTVCESAHCPNMGECFARGTATFLILGNRCTRNCRFCAIDTAAPEPPDQEEPGRLALAVQKLNLPYVVITSVTRDDLPDGGARHFVRTMEEIRSRCPQTQIEILVPDFKGEHEAIQLVCNAHPEMFNHNIETVPRLYDTVRPQASFRRSLTVLEMAAHLGLPVKSGMMLGLGETPKEIEETLMELRAVGCQYLTLGQYLAPSQDHLPVARYIQPREFDEWGRKAKAMGFNAVVAGPLVRSSYRADQMRSSIGAASPIMEDSQCSTDCSQCPACRSM